MAPRASMLRLALCAVACSALCGGSPSEECPVIDDDVSLHQRQMTVHPAEPPAVPPQGLIVPSKNAAAKMRPLIRETADGVLKRATSALKLPTIPAVFRWELVGKFTQSFMERYQKPRTPAVLGLLNDMIELSSDAYGSKEIGTMTDEELLSRLGNVTRLHGIAQRYLSQTGAPPAMGRFVDSLAEALQKKGSMDPRESEKLLLDVANESSGPALAELLQYGQQVAAGKVTLDAAKVTELEVPVLSQFGAPPAVGEFMRVSANMTREHVTPDPAKEGARLANMLALSAQQLGMPPAFEESFAYAANVIGNASNSHVFENPAEMTQVFLHFNGLMVKINDQLGGPPAISELIALSGAPPSNESIPDALGLLAKVSRQLSLPSAVTEFLEYVAPISLQPSHLEPGRVAELIYKLTGQLGAPDAIVRFGREAGTIIRKSGGNPDPQKLTRLTTQLLRKLGMPALADIIGHLAGPLAKGKQLDALTLAATAPSLMKVLPDLKVGDELLRGMRAKLIRPILLMYEQAVEKLTANMPQSQAKVLLTRVLKSVGPHL